MQIIKTLSKMIEDELDDSEKYVKAAMLEHDNNPALADLFYALAREEMGHKDRLHNAVVKIIKTYRDEHGDPPAGMQVLYDYLHEAHMERSARIQVYINQYADK